MTQTAHQPLPGVPRRAFAPGLVLAGLCVLAYAVTLGDMRAWGISAASLEEGRWWTLVTHMFAHGGLLHLSFNALLLFFLSGPITVRMGPVPLNWIRFALLFVACGLGGALAYILIDSNGTIPAVGASGAIFGMVGLMARLPRPAGPVSAEYYQRLRPLTFELIGRNLFLIGILTLPGLIAPGFMGIAWEAHLGGFLTGFLVGPVFLAPMVRLDRADGAH